MLFLLHFWSHSCSLGEKYFKILLTPNFWKCVYISDSFSSQACANPSGQVVNRCLRPFASINTHSSIHTHFPWDGFRGTFPQSLCVAFSSYSTQISTPPFKHTQNQPDSSHTCCRDSCGNICIIKCLLKIIAADFQDII